MPTDKVTDRIPEWKLQAAIAAELDSMGQPYAASLEGVIGNLNPYQARLAKATGVKRGEPDLRLYFPAGRIVFVEVKGANGRLTPDQRERIPMLERLGFVVHVLKAESEESARQAIRGIVMAENSR